MRVSRIVLPLILFTLSCLFGQAATVGEKETGLAAVYTTRLNVSLALAIFQSGMTL